MSRPDTRSCWKMLDVNNEETRAARTLDIAGKHRQGSNYLYARLETILTLLRTETFLVVSTDSVRLFVVVRTRPPDLACASVV